MADGAFRITASTPAARAEQKRVGEVGVSLGY